MTGTPTPKRASRRAQLLAWLTEADQQHPRIVPNDGRCRETDAEVFHPGPGGTAAPALRICRGCDVRGACLAYALDADERQGIWGGATANERAWLRKIRRTRDQQGAA